MGPNVATFLADQGVVREVDSDVADFLEHAGVKGMKWGVRKAAAPGSRREFRQEARTARKNIASVEVQNFKNRYTNTSNQTGKTKLRKTKTLASIADVGLTFGVYTGYQMTQASGFSKGQSFAIAALAGGPGSVIASSIKRDVKAARVARSVIDGRSNG